MTLVSVDSPGKKLHDRRLEKKLSISDVARMTHIRQDRIMDLEKDDYSNFPSLAYARGFLLIYARLLEVDVTQAAARLEKSNPVDIAEYEYLSGRPAPLTRSVGTGGKVFAILFGLVSLVVAGVIFIVHILNTSSRLDDWLKDKTAITTPTPAPTPVAPTPTPEPVVVKQEPLPTPNLEPPAPVDNDVVLRPLKKAWVRVHQDSVDAPPIYEDYLYPDANGLKLHGKKFWIQLGEGDSVEITKNGKPVPYTSPGIVVQ